jgi:hypothetical protein
MPILAMNHVTATFDMLDIWQHLGPLQRQTRADFYNCEALAQDKLLQTTQISFSTLKNRAFIWKVQISSG